MKLLPALLFSMLLLVVGCETSPKPAPDLVDIRRWQAAAEHGDIRAQCALGEAYASHWRPVEACIWFRRAAEHGSPEAEYRLAQNYQTGSGVPQDPIEAYAWFDVAAAQGHLLAVNARQHHATHMNAADVEAGVRRAGMLLAKIPPQNVRYKVTTGTDEKLTEVQSGNTYSTAYTAANNPPTRTQPAPKPATVTPKPAVSKPTPKPEAATPKAPATAPKAPAKSKPLHYGSTQSKGAMQQIKP